MMCKQDMPNRRFLEISGGDGMVKSSGPVVQNKRIGRIRRVVGAMPRRLRLCEASYNMVGGVEQQNDAADDVQGLPYIARRPQGR